MPGSRSRRRYDLLVLLFVIGLLVQLLLLLLGVTLLYAGGELLVRNASHLARRLQLSPLVIGLTVVAFGTSTPELAASVVAALRGTPAIAVGNIVGSNIANIGLILGLAALVCPLATSKRFLQREGPFLIVAAASLFPLVADGRIGRLEGAVLLLLLFVYLVWLVRTAAMADGSAAAEALPIAEAQRSAPGWQLLLGLVGGLLLLFVGARVLVDSAVLLARLAGVSERVIGLTLVAVGTSLPELASSLVAALRKETDIVLGNIVGSNIFNVFGILGVTGLVQPLSLPFAEVQVDLGVMMAFSLLVVPFLATGYRLGRSEAVILLLGYLAYLGWLFAVSG